MLSASIPTQLYADIHIIYFRLAADAANVGDACMGMMLLGTQHKTAAKSSADADVL